MRRARNTLCLLFGLSLAALGCEKKEGLRITGISPTSGPYQGRDPVTILGSGFQAEGARGVKVYFGDKAANVLGFQGDNRLTVEPPPGAKGKTVDITLIFDDARQLVYEKAYTYVDVTGFGVNELVSGKASPAVTGDVAVAGQNPAAAPAEPATAPAAAAPAADAKAAAATGTAPSPSAATPP